MDTQMTDANQTVDTTTQIDVVVPKNPPKLLCMFLKFVNAQDIINELKNTWPQFQQIGKPSKPKKAKGESTKGNKSKKSKSDASDGGATDSQDAPPPPPKRERKIRMSYKKAVDMIRKLSIDDETKAKLEENVKELYKAVKDV